MATRTLTPDATQLQLPDPREPAPPPFALTTSPAPVYSAASSTPAGTGSVLSVAATTIVGIAPPPSATALPVQTAQPEANEPDGAQAGPIQPAGAGQQPTAIPKGGEQPTTAGMTGLTIQPTASLSTKIASSLPLAPTVAPAFQDATTTPAVSATSPSSALIQSPELASDPPTPEQLPANLATPIAATDRAEPITGRASTQAAVTRTAGTTLASADAQSASTTSAEIAPPTQINASTPQTVVALPSAAILAAPTTDVRSVSQPSIPSSPAAQVAQALVEPVKVVLTSPSQPGSTATHVTTIQIAPVELGRVDIRIERTADGQAKIQLVAERPDTLSRLVHDQSHLHQALDQAGLAATGRTIEFTLAPSPAANSSLSSNLASGNPGQNPNENNGAQRQGGRYSNQGTPSSDETPTGSSTTFRTIHTGIDITA